MSPVDLTAVLKDASVGMWIALSKNQEIVGTGKTPEEAAAEAKAKGETMPFVIKVPPASAWIV